MGIILTYVANLFAAEQAVFYVAPSGSDANAGTKEAPFKTIQKAQQAVRAINSSMTGDIVVYLRDGTYALDNTLRFNNSDGGTNGFYVRYENYTGEKPFITGGIPISSWTLCDEAKDIWCAEGVDARFRQLYVNGKKGIRARHPNLNSDGSHNMFRLTKVDSMGRAFDVSSEYTGDWKNMNKVEMHLMIAWADAVLRLEKIEKNGSVSKVIPQDPERSKLFRRKYPMLGTAFMSNPPKQQAFYFENAYEFLDQPGEWYLDETTDILYYKPRTGESLTGAAVVAPNLETLVEIKGESTKSKVQNMKFKGLIFANSNFLRPSKEGFLNLQAGQFNVEVLEENGLLGSNKFLLWRPNAGVSVTNVSHFVFERNIFTQMAATGLDFISGTNTTTDNDGNSPEVIANAGIEDPFADILNYSIPLPDFSKVTPQAPFSIEIVIPGTIQNENYDVGGQRNSYYDMDSENQGAEYREDAVDIVAVTNGYAIGYTSAGEWLEYSIDVKEAGAYQFRANVSTGLENSSFQLFLDNVAISDTIVVPQGEDWDTYGYVEGETTKELTTGKHVLKVLITGSYVNLDWILFAKDLNQVAIPSIRPSWNDVGNRDAVLHIYNLQGVHQGSFAMNGVLTKDALISKMQAFNYKAGVYFVRSKNGFINKMIELRK